MVASLERRIRAEIARSGVPRDVVEKDYAIGYVLAGVLAVSDLNSRLVFKGGTALRKAYFKDYRLRRGLIERRRRGLYVATDAEWTEHHAFAEIALQAPGGVICLLSALSFHDMTTQIPFEAWLAIDRKARAPKTMSFQVRMMRFSGAALTTCVEEHIIEGVPVRIFGPAKTVVDCFRYRNKIGFDVALEALRDCYRMRLATVDDLW